MLTYHKQIDKRTTMKNQNRSAALGRPAMKLLGGGGGLQLNQSKSESPLIVYKRDEEGVCYFLKSRLPTAQGTVNGKKVKALRNTGCTGCVVRRSLVSSDQ